MSELLVSVRSVDEAIAACEGGAALIDVKEPQRGALGRADDRVIQDVVQAVGRHRPVSAALGEWADGERSIPEADLTYVKFGLAGCARLKTWREIYSPREGLGVRGRRPQLVLVAYVDWQCAQAPSIDEVFALAAEQQGSVLLVDTHCKDANNVLRKERPTLLDWLPAAWIDDLCRRCRAAQVKIALAGSLGVAEIRTLLDAQPDWFAVRGAVCEAGDRQSGVRVEKVRELVELIRSGCRSQVDEADTHPSRHLS